MGCLCPTPQDSHAEALTPDMMAFRGGAGVWGRMKVRLGHKGGALVMGLFKSKKREKFPSSSLSVSVQEGPWEDAGRGGHPQVRKWALTTNQTSRNRYLGVSRVQTEKIHFCLSHPVFGIFLQQPEQTRTSSFQGVVLSEFRNSPTLCVVDTRIIQPLFH